MPGDEKKEFGDYQTPPEFCLSICEYMKNNMNHSPKAILEPTCGVGNFLSAASSTFSGIDVFGIDINQDYVWRAQKAVPNATIAVGNIFGLDTRRICKENDVLIIGNPPWATNSNLSFNLPQKINFKGLRGIEALTGSSNFDICEYIILQLLEQYKNTNSIVCMICKTSVARNIILEMSRKHIAHQKIELLLFNCNKVFGISAAAGVLVIQLSSCAMKKNEIVCEIKNFETRELSDVLTVTDGTLKSIHAKSELEGTCQLKWRQGIKHDCGKVMELELCGGTYVNKLKEAVSVEDSLVFPLVKSSHFKKPIIRDFSKYVLVTQTKPKQDTFYIQSDFPLTWDYLTRHSEYFSKRKSSIYKKAVPFAMFGIGDYSFAPYKVGLSGFYKKPLFCLLTSDKPVMVDDTAYFLPFHDHDIAYCMMLLLNSKPVQEFLLSIAFLDNKRPFTARLLSKLDLKKCVSVIPFEDIRQTERDLSLDAFISAEVYERFTEVVRTLVPKTH